MSRNNDKIHAAENSADSSTFALEAIGTQWKIDTRESLNQGQRQRILKRIERFDTTYSRFRPDSLVSRIAAAPNGGQFDFPDDSIPLFDFYDRLGKVTEGAVDPLVGRDLELLGYDREYSLIPASELTRAKERKRGRKIWSKDVARHGTTLTTQSPLVIDVGAAGKGYLVDIVSEILRQEGMTKFIVDGSGDIYHSGEFDIRIGLEHPFDSKSVIGVANLKNQGLCASAINRRAWGNGLNHVVDARTGIPVHDVVATWVVADEAMIADGLATSLFFTSGSRLAETFHFSYVRMFADGRAEMSQNFDGELFT
ncbi:MAG: FAD:protein FMN transferase [Sporolactobacillus sp.]